MADFFQNGVIATLHDLGDRPTADLEAELSSWAAERPMALVIPCLASEMNGPALGPMVEEIARIPYLDEVVIGLNQADEADFDRARRLFDRLPQHHRILWHDGPRLSALHGELTSHGLAPTQPGKGSNVWYCLGYFLASDRAQTVALHDADVRTYDRRMVARLLYPVVHPSFEYAFSKGYYYRTSAASDDPGGRDGERLYGRVSRLFVTPLVRALGLAFGRSDFLDYLDSFRYPLGGEYAMHADLVRTLRIPADWGLEIGLLADVYRRYTTAQVCQVDIADQYDHKHQDLSPDDAGSGLHKMSIDTARSLFARLAASGTVLTHEGFQSLDATYTQAALDLVARYGDDAAINGLTHDRHLEEAAVEMFARAVIEAGEHFLADPNADSRSPSWSQVRAEVPDLPERLAKAVEADRAG
ncbi:MAG: glycosyl transferase [Acidimicrobiaceae bacterium]|jgi:glucosyl-3-phosphoglycerate synthase|nr:glycosyl transferase [Acidimicrobiaceae bacterium]